MKKFALDYIKSFEHSDEIEIKPVTIFVGKNSCGKSSLLRFPVVLAQTFREEALTPLLLFGSLIDYGNYDDVTHRHIDSSIGFRITFGPELMSAVNLRYGYLLRQDLNEVTKIKSIEVRVYIYKPSKRLRVKEIELYIEGKKLCTVYRKNDVYNLRLYQIFFDKTWKECEIDATLPDLDFNKFLPRIDAEEILKQYMKERNILKESAADLSEYESVQSYVDYIDNNVLETEKYQTMIFYQTLLMVKVYFIAIASYMKDEAERTAYIGPFREAPKRTYRDSESSFKDVGVYGENASMILRQASQGDYQLLKNVSEWLQKAMGYTLNIQDIGNSLYSLAVCKDQESDNIMDVGFGISQVLPIVTQLYDKGEYEQRVYGRGMLKRRTVILEQPEIHLHPAAQAQLADLFVDCVCNKKGAVGRILIETHSEHLIRKLQVLVADPEVPISDDQVAVYYVDKNQDGDSYVGKMELDERGQFEKAWPKGFFDKSYELTKMLVQASSKAAGREKRND